MDASPIAGQSQGHFKWSVQIPDPSIGRESNFDNCSVIAFDSRRNSWIDVIQRP